MSAKSSESSADSAARPTGAQKRWSMDVVGDTLLDGQRIQALTVINNLTREGQILKVDEQLTWTKVVQALDRISKRRGYPKMMAVENPVIETFNGQFRDECLNAQVFVSLQNAKRKIERWASNIMNAGRMAP